MNLSWASSSCSKSTRVPVSKSKISRRELTLCFLRRYEPRCYLFPVFELARRLFLSSVLAVFYPGSTRQVIIGLLGAMLSCIVYFYYEAFTEDDDDVVSAVAQVQLVLVYFAALAIYAADGQDEKEAAFSGVAFGVVLLLIFFASFVVAAYVTLLEIFGYSSLRSVYAGLFTRGSSTAATHRSSSGKLTPDDREEAVEEIAEGLHDGTSATSEQGGDEGVQEVDYNTESPQDSTSLAADVDIANDDRDNTGDIELCVGLSSSQQKQRTNVGREVSLQVVVLATDN